MGTTPSTQVLDDGLARLHAMDAAAADAAFHTCCGSTRWADEMTRARPFTDRQALFRQAEQAWLGLDRESWLEAFAHHPRIGQRDLAGAGFAPTAAQAAREQSGMAGASDAQRQEFITLNAAYEARFGHVFLICATGKTAAFMLARLKDRLNNDPATELLGAAKEQAMILRIRLERMLNA
ncbi:MAG: 2-oxo-4-hydroxy-4-carboxy-5-ureidoimidazoline decarboxylase [Phycisphaerales bacterium]